MGIRQNRWEAGLSSVADWSIGPSDLMCRECDSNAGGHSNELVYSQSCSHREYQPGKSINAVAGRLGRQTIGLDYVVDSSTGTRWLARYDINRGWMWKMLVVGGKCSL
jgi:hypothetical protein